MTHKVSSVAAHNLPRLETLREPSNTMRNYRAFHRVSPGEESIHQRGQESIHMSVALKKGLYYQQSQTYFTINDPCQAGLLFFVLFYVTPFQ